MVQSLRNHFLISMPQLVDPNFDHTIVYVCDHNDNGAMGIVINRPMDLTLGDIFEHLQISDASYAAGNRPVLAGGPVQMERGFVLHRMPRLWDSTLKVDDGVYLTTSKDILDSLAREDNDGDSVVALGYAGWGPGQLEQEMADNAWLAVPADLDILFNTPLEHRWMAVNKLLGFDINLMSHQVGHA